MNDFEHLKLKPFFDPVADQFLQALSESHDLPLPAAARKKVVQLIGTSVPYFLQIMFPKLRKPRRSGASTSRTRRRPRPYCA